MCNRWIRCVLTGFGLIHSCLSRFTSQSCGCGEGRINETYKESSVYTARA